MGAVQQEVVVFLREPKLGAGQYHYLTARESTSELMEEHNAEEGQILSHVPKKRG
jgi:hypothetical protein